MICCCYEYGFGIGSSLLLRVRFSFCFLSLSLYSYGDCRLLCLLWLLLGYAVATRMVRVLLFSLFSYWYDVLGAVVYRSK